MTDEPDEIKGSLDDTLTAAKRIHGPLTRKERRLVKFGFASGAMLTCMLIADPGELAEIEAFFGQMRADLQ